MLVPFSLVGKTAQHRSPGLSNQRTVGFYPEVTDEGTAIHSFPGLKLFGSVNRGIDRGMFEFQGVVYKVTGKSLYSVDRNGNHSEIGTIAGDGRCVFAGITNDLIVVSEGNVYFYDVDSPEDTSSFTPGWTYTGNSFDVSGEVTSPGGAVFGNLGLNLYIVDRSSSIVYQYDLDVPYDITTAGYSGKSLDCSSEDTAVYDITFSQGYQLITLGTTNGKAYIYNLSTNWDISTATYDQELYTFSAQDTAPIGIIDLSTARISAFVMAGDTNNTLYRYELISDKFSGDKYLRYTNDSLSVAAQDTNPRDVTLAVDELTMFVLGGANDTIFQYNLTTAADISTGTYSGNSLSVSAQDSNPIGIMGPFGGTNNIYMVGGNNKKIYQYSVTTAVTDGDLESPNAVAHLNTQAIYDGLGGRWCVSDVGDATSINSLNYATAESSPDLLVRPYTFQQNLFLFGEKTIEQWWNSGVGNPPFDRIEGGIWTVGLAALHSTAHTDNYLYFLGDDRKVYRITSSSKEMISTISLAHAFESYTDVSDAIGQTYSFEGQNFYQLTFPGQGKTWCFSESSNLWFEPADTRYIGNSFVYAYNKTLVADYRNGNIYELDINTYDNNGEVFRRFRQTGAIHGGLFNKPGKPIEMSYLELIMEVGTGTTPATPVIDLNTISYQSGKTYNFSTQDTNGQQVVFNGDGTKMYVAGNTGDAIFQYTLSTAWDPSTATYATKTFSVASQSGDISSIFFKPDGLVMYILDSVDPAVYQYSLSTAWDVSTATYATKTFNPSSQETTPKGLTFKFDGTKVYITGTANDTVYQYSLSTAWDISTASYDSVSLNASTQATAPNEIGFNEAGDTILLIDNGNTEVYQYNLTTAWDLSTATYSGKKINIPAAISNVLGMYVTRDYVFANTPSAVYRFTPPPTDNRYNPIIMMSFSDDNGDTFSTEMRGNVGRQGQFVKIWWHGLGRFYNRIFRFSTSDPVFYSMRSIAADIEIGI